MGGTLLNPLSEVIPFPVLHSSSDPEPAHRNGATEVRGSSGGPKFTVKSGPARLRVQ